MDPNKDFIHIDDMFKGLKDGEEPERSGAWLNMKDLLDKQMPVGTAVTAGRSFRRYITPLVASLLLLGGSAATYVTLNNKSEDKIASNKTEYTSSSASNTQNAKSSGASGTNAATTGADKHNNTNNNSNKTNNSSKTALATTSNTNKQPAVTAHKTKQPAKGSQALQNNNAAKPNASKPGSTTKQQNIDRIAANQSNASVIEEQNIIERTTPKRTNNIVAAQNAATQNLNQFNAGGNSNNLTAVAKTLNNKKIVQSTEGTYYKEERDTFSRIDVTERYVAAKSLENRPQQPKTVIDTVAVTRIEKIRYVPLTKVEVLALQKMSIAKVSGTVVPMAHLKRGATVSKELVNFVPLNNYKVASRKVGTNKFNDMVKNTTGGIANYFDGSRNFYAAILVGGNTSFGNPSAFGMQFGIAGIYALSERLSFMAELKFANHYFSNYTLEDKSVTYDNITAQQVAGSQWLFSGTEYTSTSAYKMNNFYTFEMPLTLSYNLGRVSVFGGVNLAYASPIKWNKQTSLSSSTIEKTQAENKTPFYNTGNQFNEQTDFASRLGLGYVMGASYDFSRKVSLDARMTQILTDNAQGNIHAINKLFRMPTMQLSIGYYFGRKDKVVYIMDRK